MATVAGERRIVTVLFADVVGSTAIGERLGPERTKLLFDEVMRVMSAEVERFGGTVAQFVGDELYAVFGAPHAHEDDSERAVRAAVAIQGALGLYASEVAEAYDIDLACRIAINTGPGVIAPDSEDPYNALGETVNVASRIRSSSTAGRSSSARRRAPGGRLLRARGAGPQDLRGVSTPVRRSGSSARLLQALPSRPARSSDGTSSSPCSSARWTTSRTGAARS
jgi:class 3 adenylate cyclase